MAFEYSNVCYLFFISLSLSCIFLVYISHTHTFYNKIWKPFATKYGYFEKYSTIYECIISIFTHLPNKSNECPSAGNSVTKLVHKMNTSKNLNQNKWEAAAEASKTAAT